MYLLGSAVFSWKQAFHSQNRIKFAYIFTLIKNNTDFLFSPKSYFKTQGLDNWTRAAQRCIDCEISTTICQKYTHVCHFVGLKRGINYWCKTCFYHHIPRFIRLPSDTLVQTTKQYLLLAISTIKSHY